VVAHGHQTEEEDNAEETTLEEEAEANAKAEVT
jgi:hypothetical protein